MIVIVIDMLNDFFHEGRLAESRATLTHNINRLVEVARARSWSVVWVRQEFRPDLSDAFLVMKDRGIRTTIGGTDGCQFLSELRRRDGDLEIVKRRYSAFFGTDLEQIVGERQPRSLVLCGVNTHACVRTTAIDAYQRDLRVVIPTDCVDSYDRRHHDMTLAYLGNGIARLSTLAEIEEQEVIK